MQKNTPKKRKQIRLKEYDYSTPGYYFITICTQNRKEILSKILINSKNEHYSVGANCVRPQIQLSNIGKILNEEISKIPNIYENVTLDEYVIMPNHIHIIIGINYRRTQFAPTISQIIKQYKGSITKKLGYSIWQKSFYEHIIRNEKEYYKIIEYIRNNPIQWEEDEYFN